MSNKEKGLIAKGAEIAGELVNKLSGVLPAVARGAAEAEEIKLRGMMKTEDIARRAGYRLIRQQGNIEDIAHLAGEMMPPGSEHQARDMDEDWAADFAEKCKNISDKEMQLLWAKVLAGEAGNPGSFSKKTIAIVSEMSKEDAELFTVLCQFVWTRIDDDGDVLTPVIYDVRHKIYKSQGIKYGVLVDLAAAGLVSKGLSLRTRRLSPDKPVVFKYFDTTVSLTPTEEEDGHYVHFGTASLTKHGAQLFFVCSALGKVQKNDAFFRHVWEQWEELGYNPVEKGVEE